MLGAYLAFTAVTVSGQFWLSLLLVPPVVGIVGALLEASTLRFIYRRPPIYQLLLTFGLALILEESVHVLYGPTAKGVDPPALLQGSVQVLGAAYPRYRLFLVVLGVAVGVAVWLFSRGPAPGSSSAPLRRTARWRTASVRTSRACARSSSAPPAHSPGSAARRRRP